jgi:predicted GTPase
VSETSARSDVIFKIGNRAWDWLQEGGWEYVKEFRDGKLVVLVFGCTGTGKTSLINSLEARAGAAPKIDVESRTHSIIPRAISLSGTRFRIIDTPGWQDASGWESSERMVNEAVLLPLQERDHGILNRIARVGIINVVSYGYHEYSAEAREEFQTSAVMASPAALERHRDREVSAFRDMAASVAQSGTRIDWMITAVNKADLWTEEWSEVQGHYAKGAYREAFGEFFGKSITFIITRYCSIFKKFYDAIPMSGFLDDGLRSAINEHFLSNLADVGSHKPVR